MIIPLSKARNSRAYRTNLRTLLYSWPTASAVSWSKTYSHLIAPYSTIQGVNSPLQAVRRSEASRRRTKLIVFLGTPHRGSGLANWGEIVSNLVRLALQDSHKKIVETLKVDSEVLDNIHEQFVDVVFEHGIHIHSFQEGRGISGMIGLHEKVRCPSLKHAVSHCTNPYRQIQVVSDFSSKLGLPKIETTESIDANHMQMARCKDRSDESYRVVAGVLKQFLKGGSFSADIPIRSVIQTQREEIPSAQQEVDTC